MYRPGERPNGEAGERRLARLDGRLTFCRVAWMTARSWSLAIFLAVVCLVPVALMPFWLIVMELQMENRLRESTATEANPCTIA